MCIMYIALFKHLSKAIGDKQRWALLFVTNQHVSVSFEILNSPIVTFFPVKYQMSLKIFWNESVFY